MARSRDQHRVFPLRGERMILVTTVQPSFNSRTWRVPALTMGSTVMVMPSSSRMPVPGRP